MKNPKISLIMPVYNAERFLNKAVQSILSQTFEDFEFIIINDGSTDNSLDLIKDYAGNDKRIVLIDNKNNIGLTKSLNIGLKNARGNYIARIDADDIALPERLKKQYTYLEKNKDIFLIGSGVYIINSNGHIKTVRIPPTRPEIIKKILYSYNCLCHPTLMFRNKGFLYREKFTYAQDYDFYLTLLTKNIKIGNIFWPLIKYRDNSGSISFLKKSQQALFAVKAKEFYRQRAKYQEDKYEYFDPEEILLADINKITNKTVLENEIKINHTSYSGKIKRILSKIFQKLWVPQ